MDVAALASAFKAVLEKIAGENPSREGLSETPARMARAWLEWTAGYGRDPASVLKTFGDGACNEMVFQGGIQFYSLCEHHAAPFFGVAHIGYIPNGRIVGLSKMARLVDVFARRLTVQERLCNQVADAMQDNLQPLGVGVVMQARHLCLESRGVQKPGTVTVTSALRGVIMDKPDVRAEFLSMVQTSVQGYRSI